MWLHSSGDVACHNARGTLQHKSYLSNDDDMKPEKWPTLRFAMYGALAGVAYSAYSAWGYWLIPEWWTTSGFGEVLGSATGGALLAAAVSGLRNLFVR